MICLNLKKRLATIGGTLLCFLSIHASLQGVWQTPEVISDPLIPQVEGSAPVLIVNTPGNGLAIWTNAFSETWPTQSTIATSFYQQGFGWTQPAIINDLTGIGFPSRPQYQNQGDPDIAMNSSNYAVAVWEALWSFSEISPPFPVVFAATRNTNGSWTLPVIISDSNSFFEASNINVSLNEFDVALAAWRNHDSQFGINDFIAVSFLLSPGGSWTAPFYFPNFPAFITDGKPYPYINQNGNATITWEGRNIGDTAFTIEAANYIAGIWTFATLDTGTNVSNNPRNALANNGNAVAIWQNDGFINASFFNGTTWQAFVTLGDAATIGDNDGPEVVVDLDGNFTATWTAQDFSIKSASTSNGTWTPPVTISALTTQNSFDPYQSQETLAVSTNGDVIAIWHRIVPDVVQLAQPPFTPILSAYKSLGLPWRAEETVAAPSDGLQDNTLNIGLANCGFAAAIWQNQANSLVYASINGNLIIPVETAIARCCQKGSGRSCVNVLTWGQDPCVLFYSIFRNGVLIATVFNTGEPLQFIDFLAGCNPNAVYTISAVNIFGFEGTQVPFVL